jgi:hypothetical protein
MSVATTRPPREAPKTRIATSAFPCGLYTRNAPTH